LREIDHRAALDHYVIPPVTDVELKIAKFEGWILDVT
jgi:hypothetical protein